MDYEIGGKQGWTKTHCRANLGASFCRRVNMDQCDWIGVIEEGEEPSCEECKWMMKALQNFGGYSISSGGERNLLVLSFVQ